MENPRQLAFLSLLKILKDRSYSNLTVAGALRAHDLSDHDRSLYTALVYGVLERKVSLDYNLALYLKQPLKKLNPKVYAILLLGAYQVLFFDRVPDRAAINESVKLTKKNGVGFASGLTNAVLRNVSKNGFQYPSEEAAASEEAYLSIRYSVPEPLVSLWLTSYGREKTEGLLAWALGPQPLTVRVNTTKTTWEELQTLLQDEGVSSERHPHVENALVLEAPGDLSQLIAFQKGLFHVQDASSQLCCRNVDPQPGETVLDLCAAPGGKTCTMAERMENQGRVLAFDLYEKRVGLIEENAARLGLSCVHAELGDAVQFREDLPPADRVLCDVPCAGYGDLGRKPEVRFRDPGLVDNLTAVQYDILDNAERYVKLGGRLVYSTCSLNPAENEAVVQKFLEEHTSYRLEREETYFPQDYVADGFYNAVLTREA